MDLVNYKTAARADLSRISQINNHLSLDPTFTGVVEILDQTLEIGEVGDAMMESEPASELVEFVKFKEWALNGRVKFNMGTPISENHPDEYVYVIALEPFYLIKRKTPAEQVAIDRWND